MSESKKWEGIQDSTLKKYKGCLKVAALKFIRCSSEFCSDWRRKRNISKGQSARAMVCTESLTQSSLPRFYASKMTKVNINAVFSPNAAIKNNTHIRMRALKARRSRLAPRHARCTKTTDTRAISKQKKQTQG